MNRLFLQEIRVRGRVGRHHPPVLVTGLGSRDLRRTLRVNPRHRNETWSKGKALIVSRSSLTWAPVRGSAAVDDDASCAVAFFGGGSLLPWGRVRDSVEALINTGLGLSFFVCV